jgi:hypothetical protein
MRAYHVSSGENQTIYAFFPLTTAKHKTQEEGLLDSGATHNFIDIRTVIRLGIGTKRLKNPRTVTNVDGTTNRAGAITRYANLTFSYEGKEQTTPVYVTNLGKDRIILGLPWFKAFEPKISWTKGSLEGKLQARTAQAVAQINKVTQATDWAIKAEKNKVRLTEESVPEAYKDYADVFSEEKARRFPPEREEDHEIKFTADVPKTFPAYIYKMDKNQTTFLRRWIDEEIEKGFIRESKSPYPSPTFLIKKKNGDYRVVQDYQVLNSYTIPDKTPLPLISDLIEQLGKKLFTKFDIRMGYNNIRIKEGDQEKAAFTTPLGQYEPVVMSFGLRNAPGTFVRTMNRLFRGIQNKYPGEIQIYMDDILIATEKDTERHRQIVREVLEVMRKESLFLKVSKCEFERTKVDYLGLILDEETIRPDPNKVAGLKDWPRKLKSVREVRSTLGLLNYHRAFVPGFSHIVKPLTNLLKKEQAFLWTTPCTKALDKIIHILTTSPVLAQPNQDKPYELEVDASNYATGAILFQRDERAKPQPIGFHSKTFSKEEMNYDIYDKELTAMDRGLETWRHLLLGGHTIVHTDHANLTYYRQPQKLSERAKRAVARIRQYDILIKHKPGILNKADALSRRPDYPQGTDEERELAFPTSMFADEIRLNDTLPAVLDAQQTSPNYFETLQNKFPLELSNTIWTYDKRIVVAENNELRRGVISLYHDSITAGHPGVRRTVQPLTKDYWWPTIKEDVRAYIQGCATCQSTKPRTHPHKPPPSPIPPENSNTPFGTIAMDFITKLPISEGQDTILTITDHDCSKAALLFPCTETITAEGVALLYAKHVFPHYGIPSKVISDRDTRFTSEFWTTLCQKLGIKRNLSTAFHPQTDGQSERTNQWTEQYLRIFGNAMQTDWANWLPMAQYTHNAWINETTKQIPFKLLIGIVPRTHQREQPDDDTRLQRMFEIRKAADEAITKAQELMTKNQRLTYKPFHIDDQVWLEGTNLKTTHPTAKLAPKRYGPFRVTNKVSDVVYQLELPPQWKIHNVFHAGLLTPYVETELHGKNYSDPPPDIIDGQPEYEVEEIIGSRRVGAKKTLQYKVRWKGYSQAHDSWEPSAAIKAPRLIKQYQLTALKKKIESSQHRDRGTNYQADRVTQSKLNPLNPPQTYKDQNEDRSSATELEIDKGSNFGKPTRDSHITRTDQENRKPPQRNRDKKGTTSTINSINSPPLLY